MKKELNENGFWHKFGPHLRPNVHIRTWVGLRMRLNAQMTKPNATQLSSTSPPNLHSICITLLNAHSRQNAHSKLALSITKKRHFRKPKLTATSAILCKPRSHVMQSEILNNVRKHEESWGSLRGVGSWRKTKKLPIWKNWSTELSKTLSFVASILSTATLVIAE